MKNIYVLPTDKPSRLAYFNNKLLFAPNAGFIIADGKQHIYITSDEKIKEGDYHICIKDNVFIEKALKHELDIINENPNDYKKIILTTDPDLIKDGVQAIDDEFLEWFVNNPSCEFVETKKVKWILNPQYLIYEIIIPKEEPKQECRWSDIEEGCVNDECECERKEILSQAKHRALKQETLEEYINTVVREFKDELAIDFTVGGIKLGAKWQEKRSYSEEEVLEHLNHLIMMPSSKLDEFTDDEEMLTMKWFEQFKKKQDQ